MPSENLVQYILVYLSIQSTVDADPDTRTYFERSNKSKKWAMRKLVADIHKAVDAKKKRTKDKERIKVTILPNLQKEVESHYKHFVKNVAQSVVTLCL